jgi:hypothetical protein
MEIILHAIDASNADRYGFFCYKSKPKTAGYRQKREWLDHCMPEGLRLKIIYEGERSAGFIEYAPGEHTWRAVQAPVSWSSIAYGWWAAARTRLWLTLLEQVESEARDLGMYGLATVCSQSTWLAKKGFFLLHGFEVVDQAPPSLELLVKKFDSSILPSFPQDWESRLSRIPNGLVIYHSGQCPYNPMFVTSLLNAASGMGIPAQTVELKTSQEARALSPSAYGTFGVVVDGQLLSYRPMGGKTLREMLGRSNE